jgi:hypothetical protein
VVAIKISRRPRRLMRSCELARGCDPPGVRAGPAHAGLDVAAAAPGVAGLLGRYSNWTSWTDRLPAADKTGARGPESGSRARGIARRLSERDVTELVTRYGQGQTVYDLSERSAFIEPPCPGTCIAGASGCEASAWTSRRSMPPRSSTSGACPSLGLDASSASTAAPSGERFGDGAFGCEIPRGGSGNDTTRASVIDCRHAPELVVHRVRLRH